MSEDQRTPPNGEGEQGQEEQANGEQQQQEDGRTELDPTGIW